MRHTLRLATYALVTTASFVSFSGQALASSQLGTLTWSASPEILQDLDMPWLTITPTQQSRFVENFNADRERSELTAGFNAFIVPAVSSLESTFSNGSLTFSIAPRPGMNGGSLTLSNWRIDVPSASLFVDAVGSPAGGQGFSEEKVKIASLLNQQFINGEVRFDTLEADFDELFRRTFAPNMGFIPTIPGSLGTISVAAVPEPSTYMMFLLGIAGLLAAKRRR